MHVIDTSWAVFYPGLYEEAIASYQTPIFTIGEFFLIAALVYHGFNGVRIIILDRKPRLWRFQRQAAVYVLIATVVVLIPIFISMFGHVSNFYGDDENKVMPLADVVKALVPFAVGVVVALIGALAFSLLAGVVTGDEKADTKKKGSNFERLGWLLMRYSGLLIIVLAGGHLVMMHVIQGVFELSMTGTDVVGTDLINSSGTATEFAGNRWNYLLAGVAVWRLYDLALLVLAVLHGFNGLRLVLTDYTMSNPLLRRAAVYLCVIGVVVLLTVGAGALFGTIDQTAIDMAREAQQHLY
jgi:succinate dehydrogenase hydrophobic anchor subunit